MQVLLPIVVRPAAPSRVYQTAGGPQELAAFVFLSSFVITVTRGGGVLLTGSAPAEEVLH